MSKPNLNQNDINHIFKSDLIYTLKVKESKLKLYIAHLNAPYTKCYPKA